MKALHPLRRRWADPECAPRRWMKALLPLRRRRADPECAPRRWMKALLPFTGEGARRADEGARAQRSAAFDVAFRGSEGKSSSLRSRPHPALRATFSRCAGEGLIPTLAAKDGKEALLPFTGEGARRADEGARAQRSVLLMLPGRARAARFARALIRRFAPPSPAAQEKGCFRTVRQGSDEGSPSPVYGRRCPEGG